MMKQNNFFAIDENLKLPIEDPFWQNLFHDLNIQPSLYADMSHLSQDLRAHELIGAYLPVANVYSLRKASFYEGVASALTTDQKSTTFKSVLVVKKDSPIQSLDQLKGKSLGYIHKYCTSSYFAPTLLLTQKRSSLQDFFSQLISVGAWQSQIDAVIKGQVDATMVMEQVWLQHTENQKTTRVIASIEDLPTPIVIIRSDTHKAWKQTFTQEILSYCPKPFEKSLFSGFAPYQKKQVEQFFKEIEGSSF